jgi:hypothetical protein
MINLTKREKLLLKILIGIAGTAGLFFLIINPVISVQSSIEDDYKSNLSNISKLDSIYDQYKEIRQKKNYYEQLLNQTGGMTSLIEEQAKTSNISSNISYTRENPSTVQNKFKKNSTEVKFEGVDIKSVIDFIYKIENSNRLLKINYLRIHQALKGRNTYDVIIKIDSLSNQ